MEEAEVALYREYAEGQLAPLRRLAYLICGDWHLAEDVVSTVMTKLYVVWPRIRRDDNVDAYVRRMLTRAIVDERRRPWRRESPADQLWTEVEPTGPDPDALHDQLVLRAALALMPPRRRAVLVLRYFVGLSVEETAGVMRCSTGTVKSQTARALAAMREKLPPDYLVEERTTS